MLAPLLIGVSHCGIRSDYFIILFYLAAFGDAWNISLEYFKYRAILIWESIGKFVFQLEVIKNKGFIRTIRRLEYFPRYDTAAPLTTLNREAEGQVRGESAIIKTSSATKADLVAKCFKQGKERSSRGLIYPVQSFETRPLRIVHASSRIHSRSVLGFTPKRRSRVVAGTTLHLSELGA